MSELIQLDALGPKGPYRTANRRTVTDVSGVPVAELSLVPKLYVERSVAALHKARVMPPEERAAALERAGRAFANETINGLSVEDYQHAVSRVAGMPISVVRAATRSIERAAREAFRGTQRARPEGAVSDWHDPATEHGHAVWTRRGDVFAVLAPGNEPEVHALWLEVLALGYRVAVRPSQREPLTPHRLVTALREADFGADQVVFLPTDHAVADEIIRDADLAMVYGGDSVMRKYSQDARVLPQGPGRSKILLSGDDDWSSHVNTIVDSVSHYGGMACVNTTAVFVEGDPTPVAEAIAERLSAIPSLPPEDAEAVLPVQPLDKAEVMERFLLDHARGTTARLGGDGIVDDLGDGSAVLRPAVFQVDRPDAPQTAIELGFPCVWVAPWSRDDGVEPLKNSLVVTAITRDEALIDGLVNEPTISNVYLGDTPTYWMRPGIPHDSYLADFLMRSKAMIRDGRGSGREGDGDQAGDLYPDAVGPITR
ncbi:aldehyde dehydrogenase family protein [Sphaerisporangium perillae]|uniref:aldehyde dehydrogenase family protein n=1 Tax=Sphaerisporangium perillae TaxID=2935860 RepID=UPI00200D0C53|nr:aldehyde dehydrogenase family protein [Sphaerisporangium perillae]